MDIYISKYIYPFNNLGLFEFIQYTYTSFSYRFPSHFMQQNVIQVKAFTASTRC